jgi:hypothetical protein
MLTETWCNSDVTDAFLSIDGYELQPDLRTYREDSTQGRGGGLLVYAKSGTKVSKIDTDSSFQQQCMFLVNDVTFHLIYRSPNAPPAAMSDLECVIRSVKKNSILVGDSTCRTLTGRWGRVQQGRPPFLRQWTTYC